MEEGETGDGGDSQSPAGSKDDDDKDDQSQNGSSRIPNTNDAVRLKCRELIGNALKIGGWWKCFQASVFICVSGLCVSWHRCGCLHSGMLCLGVYRQIYMFIYCYLFCGLSFFPIQDAW